MCKPKSTSSGQVTIVAPSHQAVSCHPNGTKNHLGHPIRSKGPAASLNGLGQASGARAAPKLDVLHSVGREEHWQVAAARSCSNATDGTSLVGRAYCLGTREETWNLGKMNTHLDFFRTSWERNFRCKMAATPGSVHLPDLQILDLRNHSCKSLQTTRAEGPRALLLSFQCESTLLAPPATRPWFDRGRNRWTPRLHRLGQNQQLPWLRPCLVPNSSSSRARCGIEMN